MSARASAPKNTVSLDQQKSLAKFNAMETLTKGQLSLHFTLKYLDKFLADGKLTQTDLFAFYVGEDVKREFAALDVDALFQA